ncbi:hypothetical protein AB9K34_00035, partial [Sedimentitalea sp. XS_ASV28]|uniref:hypothetical protein n=1 Tax=Sedimentitalea sp. XS_ASV28 TaxID=3241296 RepID=UPI00351674C7
EHQQKIMNPPQKQRKIKLNVWDHSDTPSLRTGATSHQYSTTSNTEQKIKPATNSQNQTSNTKYQKSSKPPRKDHHRPVAQEIVEISSQKHKKNTATRPRCAGLFRVTCPPSVPRS